MYKSERKDYTYDEAVEYMQDKECDFNDTPEKCFALSNQLKLSLEELEDIKRDRGNYYIYEKEEWLIADEDEVDEIEREYVEQMIDECWLYEYEVEEKKTGRSNPLLTYLDKNKWIDDWCGNRGENLSSVDGVEYEEKVNDVWYYLYKQ
jgi:hypothetical protein